MRLYVNPGEVPLLKEAFAKEIRQTSNANKRELLGELLGRVELCEKLQNNIKRSTRKIKENNHE